MKIRLIRHSMRFIYYPVCRDFGERLPLARWELGFCVKCWKPYSVGGNPLERRLILEAQKVDRNAR